MAVSELLASATTVAKGVTNDVLYFKAWWGGDLAVAVADISDKAYPSESTQQFAEFSGNGKLCHFWIMSVAYISREDLNKNYVLFAIYL